MAKASSSKAKLLYLLKILQESSDQEHPLSTTMLIRHLEKYGIPAERKSIYDDIETLQQFGYDIVARRGRANEYYLNEREFQLPELKLLVDSVQASKFITQKKSLQLIQKLGSFASRYQSVQLNRHVHTQDSAKAANEKIYYVVDGLHTAILENRQISFQYYEWAIDPDSPRRFTRQYRRGGALYFASPWSLLWDDENYYLVAYDSGTGIFKHYRVDKMDQIQLLDLPREGRDKFSQLNIGSYSKRAFGMFGGEELSVRLRFANRLIGVVVDRFGKDITILPSGSRHFIINIKAFASPQFISWLLGFGGEVEVLAPEEVILQLNKTLQEVAHLYQNTLREEQNP